MEQDELRQKQYETGWNKIQHDDVNAFMHKTNKRDKKAQKYIHNKQDEGFEVDKKDH